MKKLLLVSFLLGSFLTFADSSNSFDILEDRFELKHTQLTDGTTQLKIDDVDIGVINNIPFINIEVETFIGKGSWDKFNKEAYKKIATNMANELRNTLGSTQKVLITLVLDPDIGDNVLLSEGQY